MAASNDSEEAVSVVAEKEKTKRTLITTTAAVIVGLTALILFFKTLGPGNRSISIDSDGVKIDLSVPITDTANHVPSQVATPFGQSVNVTTEAVPIQSLPEGVGSGNSFTGKTLVDTTSGFLLSADNPRSVGVRRNAEAGTSTITDAAGSTIVVQTLHGLGSADLDSVVQATVAGLERRNLSVKQQREGASTVLLWFRENGVQYCIKLSASSTSIVRATATIADSTRSTAILRTLGSVTPISKNPVQRLRR
jgi:hypothetical protein